MKIGRIYKIIHSQSNICYVGSTFNTLRDRWRKHKADIGKRYISIHPYIEEYGIENFKIVLIKEYEVIDRNHLEMYEQLWINKLHSVNKNITFQPLIKETSKNYQKKYQSNNYERLNNIRKQYVENNKERIKEYRKQYYESNKENICEKNKITYLCETCNKHFTLINKKRHEKSKYHLKNL
jgi:hypothetical protein